MTTSDLAIQTLFSLVAVIVGGLLATAGGIYSTTIIERRRQQRETVNLALAFKGEITALLEHIEERRYLERFGEVIAQIEGSKQPFYMPFHLRFQYDRVYNNNVNRIGQLGAPLSEAVPLFYTRLTSIMEDMVNLGSGAYRDLDTTILLRIYRDIVRVLEANIALGGEIVAEIDRMVASSADR